MWNVKRTWEHRAPLYTLTSFKPLSIVRWSSSNTEKLSAGLVTRERYHYCYNETINNLTLNKRATTIGCNETVDGNMVTVLTNSVLKNVNSNRTCSQ